MRLCVCVFVYSLFSCYYLLFWKWGSVLIEIVQKQTTGKNDGSYIFTLCVRRVLSKYQVGWFSVFNRISSDLRFINSPHMRAQFS